MATRGVGSADLRDRLLPDGDPDQEQDWPAQVAGSIERAVTTVRNRTTVPALLVARAFVYGLFAAIVGVTALVLFVIALVRVLDSYLPSAVFGDEHTWVVHLIVGVLFLVPGLVLWGRRR